MGFKVGDRVRAVENLFFAKKGYVGTVMSLPDEDNQIAIYWDKNCNGWGDELEDSFKIPEGHGEWVYEQYIELYISTYELHIICKDGITTNCVYKENGKIINRSSTRRNIMLDEFDFKEAVKNCVERVGINKGDNEAVENIDSNLIGKKFESGQRVRVINTDMHKLKDNYSNLDLYIGEIGHFKTSGEFKENTYVSSIDFDNPILNKIDKKNGCLCWNWSEVELID